MYPVPRDLWYFGAAQPGDHPYVEAVVSEAFVLLQFRKALELREAWLRYYHLPLNFQMRDEMERVWFLDWAKREYHREDFQLLKQREDYNAGGPRFMKEHIYARWRD